MTQSPVVEPGFVLLVDRDKDTGAEYIDLIFDTVIASRSSHFRNGDVP